jgi:serine/threonine protein kinase
MGPVKWMSPESLRDRQYGSPSDTWTFGIVCYELWAEKEPHDGEDLLSIGIKIRDMGITPKLPQDMPEWLQKICYQCWAYEPQQRPRMSAVAKAIRQGGSEARGESEES